MANNNLLTEYARKYGFQYGDTQRPPVKSSKYSNLSSFTKSTTLISHFSLVLTPIQPRSIIPRGPNDNAIEKQQRKMLYGFTARELEDNGCFPDPNAKLRKLSNQIQ